MDLRELVPGAKYMPITPTKELNVADLCHAGMFDRAAESLDGWRGIGLRPARNGHNDSEYAKALQWAAVISVELAISRQIAIGDNARDMLTESAMLSGDEEPFVWLGVCYLRCGEYGEAEAVLSTCIERKLSESARFLALRNLAVVKTYKSEFDKAIRLLHEAETLIDAAPVIGRGKLFLQRGLVYRHLSDLESAVLSYERAAEYFEEAGSRNYQGAVQLNLSRVLAEKGDYLRAHIYAEHAASIFHSLNDKLYAAKAWDEIARIYLRENKFEQAERAATRAVALVDKGEQEQVLAECLITHGQILSQRTLSEAVSSLTRAAEICARLGDDRQRASADQELSRLIKGAKDISTAVAAAIRPIEHRLIKNSLVRNNGIVTRVAAELGVPKETIFKKIRTQFPDLLNERRPVVKRRPRSVRTPGTNSHKS